jgi:RNA polymerase sigma factor (TIGR02999 family)
MSSHGPGALTVLLKRVSRHDKAAEQELVSLVYAELRQIAQRRLRRERPNHTMQPTELVGEVYLRLFASEPVDWQNRAHFFAVAARQMRFILVDHARKKRRGGHVSVALEAGDGEVSLGLAVRTDEDLLALDEALQKLEAAFPRAGLSVELRFFGGLTLMETAEILGVDVTTVKRDWVFAKSWLYSQLSSNRLPHV